MTAKKLDAVFEGGGVKGIGLVGAIEVTEANGYAFENVAGTSAGAIVAALVAAGYKANELRGIMQSLDYRSFQDKSPVDYVPLLGPALSIGFENGIYEGDYFEAWLRGLLKAKGVSVFGDLVTSEPGAAQDPRWRYRLQVIATDLTRERMVILPRDAKEYGIDPDKLDIAEAVRMSMSIPFFFEPVRRKYAGREFHIVDGGVLSNFPVWLFDSDGIPEWPTFGFKLVEPENGRDRVIKGPLSMISALFSTMMEAHDARYLADESAIRTIGIPTTGVRSTDFDLGPERAQKLYESGVAAAQEFFKKWNFEAYKAEFRAKAPISRSDRLWRPIR